MAYKIPLFAISTAVPATSKALVTDSNGLVASSATSATEVSYLAGVTSNIQSQINALSDGGVKGYGGTSTTSLAIATGSKTFTTQSGLAYLAGARVRASSAANSANYMEGIVTSYSGTSFVLNVDAIGGSGTYADWNFNIIGQPGTAAQVSGTSGEAVSVNAFVYFDTATKLWWNADSTTSPVKLGGRKGVALSAGGNSGSQTGQSFSTVTAIGSVAVQQFAVSNTGSVIYAAVSSGLYKSTDKGNSWSQILSATGFLGVACSSDGSKVFAVNTFNVYYSTNSGASFSSISSTTLGGKQQYIACSSDGSKVVTAGNGNIQVSSNSCTSWTQTTIISSTAKGIVVSDGGVIYVIGNDLNQPYKSPDFGSSWSAIGLSYLTTGYSYVSICCSTDGNTVFSADTGGNIYKSINAGGSFSTTTGFYGQTKLCCSYSASNVIVAMPVGALQYSTDTGTTWPSSNTSTLKVAGISGDGTFAIASNPSSYAIYTSSYSPATGGTFTVQIGPGLISGFSGMTAGVKEFAGAAGARTETSPTFNKRSLYGFASDVTHLQFEPDMPDGRPQNDVVPSGSANGSNTVFTVAIPFQLGSTSVWVAGVRKSRAAGDYTETNSTTITFASAPISGASVVMNYQAET